MLPILRDSCCPAGVLGEHADDPVSVVADEGVGDVGTPQTILTNRLKHRKLVYLVVTKEDHASRQAQWNSTQLPGDGLW